MTDLDSQIVLRVSSYAQDYIRQRATDLMLTNCRVRISRSTIGTYDPTTRRTTSTLGEILYDGPARVWEVPAGQNVVLGDQELTVSTTSLSIPYWVMPLPEKDDLVVVTESEDADLVGRSLSIEATVHGGGLRASRRFTVTISESRKLSW